MKPVKVQRALIKTGRTADAGRRNNVGPGERQVGIARIANAGDTDRRAIAGVGPDAEIQISACQYFQCAGTVDLNVSGIGGAEL